MNGLMRAAIAAHVLACALATAPAMADIYDTPGSFASYSLTNRSSDVVVQNGTDWLYASGATRYLTYQAANPYLGEGTASIAARGAVGWAQAGVSASGTGYSANAWGGWTDQISVNAAGLAGQHGTLTFSLAYNWATPSSNSNKTDDASTAEGWMDVFADANFKAVGASDATRQYQFAEHVISSSCYAVGACDKSDDWYGTAMLGTSTFLDQSKAPFFSNGLVTYTFDVVFGQQYALTIGMNANAVGQNGSASSDPLDSIAWAGLFSVHDSNGQLVDKDAVLMDSALGFDFSQAVSPVPEPQTFALLLAGLMLVAVRRRPR